MPVKAPVKAPVNVPVISDSSEVIHTGVPAAANRSGLSRLLSISEEHALQTRSQDFNLQLVPFWFSEAYVGAMELRFGI